MEPIQPKNDVPQPVSPGDPIGCENKKQPITRGLQDLLRSRRKHLGTRQISYILFPCVVIARAWQTAILFAYQCLERQLSHLFLTHLVRSIGMSPTFLHPRKYNS